MVTHQLNLPTSATKPVNNTITPFSNKHRRPPAMPQIVFRRNSTNEEVKQQSTLTRNIGQPTAISGSLWPVKSQSTKISSTNPAETAQWMSSRNNINDEAIQQPTLTRNITQTMTSVGPFRIKGEVSKSAVGANPNSSASAGEFLVGAFTFLQFC